MKVSNLRKILYSVMRFSIIVDVSTLASLLYLATRHYGNVVRLKPPPVSTLHVIKTNATSISLQWVQILDKGHMIRHYELEISKADNLNVNFEPNPTQVIVLYTFVNLIPNKVYDFVITAVNKYGSSQISNMKGKTSNNTCWFQGILPFMVKMAPEIYSESTTQRITWLMLPVVIKENLIVHVKIFIMYCTKTNCNTTTTKHIDANGVILTGLHANTSYNVTMVAHDRDNNIKLWQRKEKQFHTWHRDKCVAFSCVSVSQCVDKFKLCDGIADCTDGSDETFQHAKCVSPPIIGSLQILKTGHHFMSVRWKPLLQDSLHIRMYEVSLNGTGTIKSIQRHNPNDVLDFMVVTFSNLTKEENYTIRLRALNHFGWGVDNIITAITTTKIGLPGPVGSNVLVVPVRLLGTLRWQISWSPPTILSNNYVTELTYSVSYCQLTSLRKPRSCRATQRSKKTSVVLYSLRRSSFYHYVITVFNAKGEASREKRKANFLVKVGSAENCVNEYFKWFDWDKKMIGTYAELNLKRSVYSPKENVRFRCPKNYYLPDSLGISDKSEVWLHCTNGFWSERWPICRGPYENVTCFNEYQITKISGNSWQNPTANQLYANYDPILSNYSYGVTMSFSCSPGYSLIRAQSLTIMETTCTIDGTWTKEFPMCKGHTCDGLYVKAGNVSKPNAKRSVGLRVEITCMPGYYLWGANTSICLNNLKWSGTYLRECLDIPSYKKVCEEDGGVMMYQHDLMVEKKPYCHYTGPTPKDTSHTTQLAVGTGVPMSLAFIVTMIAAILYVRHKRLQMSRERSTAARFDSRQETVNLILPTYDEAQKSKPTTPPPSFEETFGYATSGEASCNMIEPTATSSSSVHDQPPVYSSVSNLAENTSENV